MNNTKNALNEMKEKYVNGTFSNTLEWIRGLTEYNEWFCENFYDENGNYKRDAEAHIPLKYRKYSDYGAASCGLASALMADDDFIIDKAAKAILSCYGYKIKESNS